MNNINCRLYVNITNISHILKLIHFFIYIDSIDNIRKYYRYMMRKRAYDTIRIFLRFLLKFSPLYLYIYKSRLIMVTLTDSKNNIYGVCHIDINLKRKRGIYGIVILPSLQGRGLGKILSIYTISYVFSKFRKVNTIELQVDIDNTIAIQLYRKLGFTVVQFNPRCNKRSGKWIPCYHMIVTRSQFLRHAKQLIFKK